VEWIKFYPVSNYTNATINESLGSLDEKDMKINLMEPSNGSTQYYGDNITIRVNITNYFDTPLTNANVNFTIKHNDTYSYQCSGIEEGNGYYNCSWDSSSGVLGNYSIEVNASKQYYNSNSTIWNNRFNLVKKNIKINLIKPEENSTKYRGDQITLRINLTDQSNNTVTGASVNFSVKYNETLFYDLTGVEEGNGYYNTSWNSTGKELGNYSIQVNASKQYYNSNSTMWNNRFTLETGPPTISISLSSDQAEQLSWIQINATVQDQSGYGINWTKINITQPNGHLEVHDMTNTSNVWIYNYTNTSQRGIYNITVFSEDNYGKTGSSEEDFIIYIKLNISLSSQSSIYYRDESGRINYILNDASGNALSGANVALRIRNPNGTIIWPEDWPRNYTTDENGTIVPPPSFAFTSDDTIGNYSLLSTTYYYDSITGTTTSGETQYILQLSQGGNGFTLDLEAPSEVSTTEKLIVSAGVTDGLRNIDPDWINVSLYDPANSLVCLETINGSCIYNAEMDRREAGVYYKEYSINSSLEGSWRWKVKSGKDTQTITKEIYSKLTGGPFDLRDITVLDPTVPDLEISAVAENTGENGRDVILEWNLTRTDTGESLDSGADTFYVAGNSEKVHIITPSTNYLGGVKITMILYFGTEKAGAYEVFNTAETTTTISGGGGGGGPSGAAIAEEEISKIEIINYPKEVEIEKGWSGYAILDVNNTGNIDLNNIEIGVDGIEKDWFEVSGKISKMSPGEVRNFTIKFQIPNYVKSGNYDANFTVVSDEGTDKKSFVLRIFETKKELIYYQIQSLKSRLDKLDNMVILGEKENKDMTEVKGTLDEVRRNIRIAEEYLDSKMYEKSRERIRVTNDLLDQAELQIKTAKKYFLPIFGPLGIQYQLLILTIILILSLILIIYIVKKVKHIGSKMIPSTTEIKKMILPKKNLAKLRDEEQKLKKTLELLKEEHDQGMISDESYIELKENNEKKLKKIYDEINEK
ncbi:MAG: hypothetical protein J7L08_02360, partial [Candidatus Aenigmarchaeota archaeon]|nr:hypothetical protein [Candidatus Aenigmarchaeota archaeon]